MFSGAAVASLQGWVKVSGKCFKMWMHKVTLTKVKDILRSKFQNRTFNLFVLHFAQRNTGLLGSLINAFLVLCLGFSWARVNFLLLVAGTVLCFGFSVRIMVVTH